MLGRSYRLPFRLLGIPLRLDPTFLIVLPLLAWLIGSRVSVYVRMFRLPVDSAALEQGVMPYVLGLVAAVGLFASVLVHELGHAVVGRAYHARVRSITLWLLGGMAQFDEIPRRHGAEAVIAAAGPATSLLVAAACRLVAALLPRDAAAGQFVVGYLTYTNVALAIFNLLPALPLDGGRILRSLLGLRLPHLRATQVAAAMSRGLAVALGLFGFLSGNLFLLLVAFFIYVAVAGETQHALIAEMLQDVPVADVMTREVRTVAADMRVADLLQQMLRERHLGYPVVDRAGHLVGMVDLADLQGTTPEARVEQVMSHEIGTIAPTATALDAFLRMSRRNFGRLVVVGRDRELVGILSKTDLIRAIQIRLIVAGMPAEPAAG
ncbi:MAG: site-2 protease family protein [Armatimonadota bacterium]|nr:site-2 protease family protein [Armatimonadota bacterium]MDR7484953.1 site-2 protease family protein [Armatimonadota bacterium]MDR7533656.1 site-2 protease family protein [Armatimonadota bacterium]MDR7535467.1 site-2 protease family protein [Armatimonadota bacterium]